MALLHFNYSLIQPIKKQLTVEIEKHQALIAAKAPGSHCCKSTRLPLLQKHQAPIAAKAPGSHCCKIILYHMNNSANTQLMAQKPILPWS
jgi:hypothetical protein